VLEASGRAGRRPHSRSLQRATGRRKSLTLAPAASPRLRIYRQPGAPPALPFLQLPNAWLWDMVDEFVYQYQAWAQYRGRLAGKSAEELDGLVRCEGVWGAQAVVGLLSELVAASNIRHDLSTAGEPPHPLPRGLGTSPLLLPPPQSLCLGLPGGLLSSVSTHAYTRDWGDDTQTTITIFRMTPKGTDSNRPTLTRRAAFPVHCIPAYLSCTTRTVPPHTCPSKRTEHAGVTIHKQQSPSFE
jgi:hypothetical protein